MTTKLLTTVQAAEYLGVTNKQFQNLSNNGRFNFDPAMKVGRINLWHYADLSAFKIDNRDLLTRIANNEDQTSPKRIISKEFNEVRASVDIGNFVPVKQSYPPRYAPKVMPKKYSPYKDQIDRLCDGLNLMPVSDEDSLFLPCEHDKRAVVASAVRSAIDSRFRLKDNNEKRFSIRTLDKGIGVWRTK